MWGNDHANVVGSLRKAVPACFGEEEFPAAKEAAAEALAINVKLHGPKHWRVTDARWELADVNHSATLTRSSAANWRKRHD